ncbi:Uncharacterised protein [Vibrio cholerae]|nr:Uncharacterised protein [Vibrio cholerae]
MHLHSPAFIFSLFVFKALSNKKGWRSANLFCFKAGRPLEMAITNLLLRHLGRFQTRL